MNSASINDYYMHEHDRLDELFHQSQTLKTSDRVQAANNFREFIAGLEQHFVWEEEILFPSFETKFRLSGGSTEVLRWAHPEIRKFLDALAEKLAREDFDTEAEEMGLQAVLCPHNQKEEGILYPMIDQITGAEERAELLTRMSAGA